jgi:glycosyltransferase involved in cell wall biosynthesis
MENVPKEANAIAGASAATEAIEIAGNEEIGSAANGTARAEAEAVAPSAGAAGAVAAPAADRTEGETLRAGLLPEIGPPAADPPVPEKEAVATGVETDRTLARKSRESGPERPAPGIQELVAGRIPSVRPLRLALVVQRYGEDVNGGAEAHCRLVAEHLARAHRVEVLTSCARDYITWKNERAPGLDEVNGVPVRRFKVKRPRDPDRFGRCSQKVFLGKHRLEDELLWLEEQGPFSPALLRHIRGRESDYDYFIFFSYRYYHSYHGIKAVPRKSILVPTAERDEVVSLGIFRDLFRLPRAIVYNSIEERAMIWSASGNRGVPGDVVGVGSELPATADGHAFRRKFEVARPYMVFLGRVDPNKGCRTLFHYFRRYREETGSALDLLLVGGKQMEVPPEPGVRYLGFLSEEDKWGALAGAELLVMPSELESLSMVTLEAWGMGKPVLANGKCDVLRGQCRRSNAGLYFDDYYEFRETLSLLEQNPDLRAGLGANGRTFYQQNYRWEVVEGKYNRILETLSRDDRARPPAPKPGFFASLFSRRS